MVGKIRIVDLYKFSFNVRILKMILIFIGEYEFQITLAKAEKEHPWPNLERSFKKHNLGLTFNIWCLWC